MRKTEARVRDFREARSRARAGMESEDLKHLSAVQLIAELSGNPNMHGKPWGEVYRRLAKLEEMERPKAVAIHTYSCGCKANEYDPPDGMAMVEVHGHPCPHHGGHL